MAQAEISKVALAVELKGSPGKVFYVALPQDRLRMMVQLAEGLSDTGNLPLTPAPDGTTLGPIG